MAGRAAKRTAMPATVSPAGRTCPSCHRSETRRPKQGTDQSRCNAIDRAPCFNLDSAERSSLSCDGFCSSFLLLLLLLLLLLPSSRYDPKRGG